MFAGRTETGNVFYTSSLWTFITCCLFWTSAQGQYHLISLDKPIIAAPGDDVILPCRVDPVWNAEKKTVEWSKPDLKTDSSDGQRGVEYVFVYRFQSPDWDIMMASYVQRTSLSSEGLKHGDVSLNLRNVTQKDNGWFRCFIPNLKIDAEVLLLVDPTFVSTTPSETPDNRNLITADPPDEADGTAPSRNRTFLVVPFCLFILFIICLGIYSVCIKEEKLKVQLLDPESGSAGSDQQDPLSTEHDRKNPDSARLHG